MTRLAWRALFFLMPMLLETSAASAQVEIFRWLDADGDLHYSQGVDSVPLGFRGKAVVIGYDRPPEASGPSESSAPSRPAQVKFIPGQPIMVTARINGSGTALLMLDTGATRTVIRPTVLGALGVSYANVLRASLKGVTGEAQVEAVKLESLEVDGAKHGPLLVISHDPGFSGGDGLLGRDYLDNFTITIDNMVGVVTLTPK